MKTTLFTTESPTEEIERNSLMPLDDKQSDRLQSLISELEALTAATDQDGAEEILDELYLLVTKIYERFPELDTDDE